jgi:hypothetical protein
VLGRGGDERVAHPVDPPQQQDGQHPVRVRRDPRPLVLGKRHIERMVGVVPDASMRAHEQQPLRAGKPLESETRHVHPLIALDDHAALSNASSSYASLHIFRCSFLSAKT